MSSIAVLMSFWFVVFPAHPVTDLLYLAIFAAIILMKVFARVYPVPMPKLDISILGHVMLIRAAGVFVCRRFAAAWMRSIVSCRTRASGWRG